MVTCNCKPSKLKLGTLPPQFTSIRNPRNVQLSIAAGQFTRNTNCIVFSSKWNHSAAARYTPPKGKDNQGVKNQTKSEEGEERENGAEDEGVHCEVEVVSWRERRIKAETLVHADVESVWNALTDYERLADFVPNLVSSGRIPCPYPGRIWLEQRGVQRALYWQIEARVVLDLQEFINSDFDRELHFSMVDGDFKKFEGKWSVRCGTRSSSAILSYEVNVIPRFNFPAIFLERIIRSDLPVNLRALACRAERKFGGNQNITVAENSFNRTSTAVSSSLKLNVDGSLNGKDNLSPAKLKESFSVSSLGPLTPSFSDSNNKLGLLGKACSLDRHGLVDEVHLRRFDGLLVTY
ncbi:Coenzyme Q-binding protein COQ10, START domain containing protein [Trema orientale]|uniref:Coenzyme Q-binding protein COQ10, START domain containing protein n=1 Tax=Trema orientale TaxID=63057 RepID=A0A2P5ETI4_TREOI|nr:Coenzyme Q-binding protein COQ10, START domain containing protein [Trema orientale]